MRNHRRTAIAGAGLAVLMTGVLSACSSSSKSNANAGSSGSASTSATTGATGSNSSGTSGVPSLASLYQGLGSAPPSSGPPAAKGKTIWWVSCGEAIPGCSLMTSGAKEAAAVLGWNFHVADGNLNQNGGWVSAMYTAVAAKPDAIIDESMDCSIVEQPLKQAKAAGIPVIAAEASDCNSPTGGNGGPSLFAGPTQFSQSAPTASDYITSWGTAGGAYVVDKTGGNAKIIDAVLNNPLGHEIDNGFTSTIKKCSGCSVVGSFNFVPTDQTAGGPFAQELQAMLVKYPDANVVYLPLDSELTTAGGAKIVQQAGRNILLVGGQGQDPGVVSLVKSGAVSAMTSVTSADWVAFAAVDDVNRILNNSPTVPEGVGVIVVDATHGISSSGAVSSAPFDVKATYSKLWGVSG